MGFEKTRVEIAQEMVNAARGCWNHYCDDPILEEKAEQILTDILRRLPTTFSTHSWTEYAVSQQKRCDEESGDNILEVTPC